MKTLKLALTALSLNRQTIEKGMLAIILILGWLLLPNVLRTVEPTAALLDAGIWQLIVLALLCYMALLEISWRILSSLWQRLGLINLTEILIHFKDLTPWQQLGFFWASFALLFWAGIACLAAIV